MLDQNKYNKKKKRTKKDRVIYNFEFEVLTDDVFVKEKKTINSYVTITSSSLESAEKRLIEIFNNNSLPIYSHKLIKKEKL